MKGPSSDKNVLNNQKYLVVHICITINICIISMFNNGIIMKRICRLSHMDVQCYSVPALASFTLGMMGLLHS